MFLKIHLNRFLTCAFLLLVISIWVFSPASSRGELSAPQSPRIFDLRIKILFLGFDRNLIDIDYMKWLLPSYDVRSDFRVNFTFTYTFQFSPDSLTRSFANYLRSIEEREKRNNPFLDKDTANYFYDANSVEGWLYSNRGSYGDLPQDGYAAIVANLKDLPTPHYYRVRYRDIDLGGEFGASNRNYWMVGWGGHHRFYYIDMSAGPHEGSYQHQPLWRFSLGGTAYDAIWLTTYLSQVIEEIVWNLFAPEALYTPPLSDRYQIVIFVLDDDTEVDLARTLNEGAVRRAFEELVPYAAWEIKTTFASLRRYPELRQVFQNSFDAEDKAYALQSVRSYIEGHLSEFIRGSPGIVVLPAFAFVLSQNRGMGPLEKWKVRPIAGQAPGKAIYAFLSVTTTKSDGIGFTQTIIHELGHLMGLRHPHQYGASGTFVASAMSYTQNEYTFSIFNKDFVARTQADILMAELESKIQELEGTLLLRKASPSVRGILDEVRHTYGKSLQAYGSMDYSSAVQEAKNALDKAKKALQETKNLTTLAEELDRLSNEVVVWRLLTIGLMAGLISLIVLTVYLWRRAPIVRAVQSVPPRR